MTRWSSLALASLATAALGCAPPEGVDLRLVPDPNLNSEAQVLAALDSIVLVVDSPEGLYPPGSERTAEGVQIEDADADPSDLELVATIAAAGDRLPLIRLERGTLPQASLELRFLGLPAEVGAPASVVGRVQGVRLSSPIEELAIPFNLRPELLPPRVTEVLPSDGSTIGGCDVSKLYVMFSRPVDPASLDGAIAIEPGVIDEVRLDPSGLTAELRISGLSNPLEDGLSYALTIDASVRDAEGRALDQIPSEPGAQGYVSSFALLCGPGPDTPEVECSTGGPVPPPTCPFPGRLECVEGFCVPSSCEQARCDDGTICDPVTSLCALDCRAWGEAEVCPADRPACDARGLCVP